MKYRNAQYALMTLQVTYQLQNVGMYSIVNVLNNQYDKIQFVLWIEQQIHLKI